MSSLQVFHPTFNSKIEIQSNGGALSSDAGLPLIAEFMEKSHFNQILTDQFHIKDSRSRVIHQKDTVFKQVLMQLIAGYPEDDAADSLRVNQLFTSIFDKKCLASQPTVSRMFSSMTKRNIEQLEKVNRQYIDQYYGREEIDTVVIDLDSTHFDTYGKQEKTDFNAHYQTYGYHPLVAYDALTGICLKTQLRSGNVYTSTNVVDFIEPLFRHFILDLHVQHILVRGDSGFATPELYDLCEKYDVHYVIRLKSNAKLKKVAQSFSKTTGKQVKCDRQYNSFDYQADSWSKERTVILQNEYPVESLFYSSTFILTNFKELCPEYIISIYKGRGLMENFIKESKLGFFMDKTDSSTFLINESRMWLSLLGYNIIQMMKIFALPKKMKKWTISTIRNRIIKVAAKIVQHSRKVFIKLDETFVYLNDYFSCAKAITAFSI